MSKLDQESVIELLVQHANMDESSARAIVTKRVAQDKENEPTKEKKPKKQKCILVEDREGKLPDALVGMVITCEDVFLDTDYNYSNNPRPVGLEEIPTLFDMATSAAAATDKGYYGNMADLRAHKDIMKNHGMKITGKESVYVIPVATTTIKTSE